MSSGALGLMSVRENARWKLALAASAACMAAAAAAPAGLAETRSNYVGPDWSQGWSNVTNWATLEVTPYSTQAGDGGADINYISMAHDDTSLYINFNQGTAFTYDHGNQQISFDTDLNAATGNTSDFWWWGAPTHVGAEHTMYGSALWHHPNTAWDGDSVNDWIYYADEFGNTTSDFIIRIDRSKLGSPTAFNWVARMFAGGGMDDYYPRDTSGGTDFTFHQYGVSGSSQSFTWNAPSGSFATGANWTPGGPPTRADFVTIANAGTATIDASGAGAARASLLDVGAAGGDGTLEVVTGGELIVTSDARFGSSTSTGRLIQSGGVVRIMDDLRLGNEAGGTGEYTLNDGELALGDSLTVGHGGNGTFTINGGTVSRSGYITVGNENTPASSGTFNMNGGTVQMSYGDFEIGDEAPGAANFTGGTFNTAPGWWISVGNRAAGTGTLTVSGTAVVNAGSVIVGRNATSTSTLNVEGGTINSADDLWVGLDGPGQSMITGGTINVADDIFIGGTSAPGTGNLNFTGGTINGADDFIVGHKANATATIGGTAQINGIGWIVVADDPGITATLNVNGGTINQSFGDLEIGDAGNGTYNQSGGTVNIAADVYIAKQAGSTGSATVSGGTLNANKIINNSASGLDINGTGTVNVRSNGSAAATSVVKSLAISGGGLLNLNDNDIIYDYTGASPEFTLRDHVLAFRDGAGTTGIGFTETVEEDTILAFGEASELGITSFNGIALDGDTIVGKYTYYGDANFDGQVTTDDYVAVDLGLGTGDSWVQGDFDLNGVVTTDDYVVVDLNLGKGTSNPLAYAEEQAAMIALHTEMFGQSYVDKLAYAQEFGWVAASVPEPGALSLIGLAGAAALARRRRKHDSCTM